MRAVVAGGAGFLGSHLCDRLVEEGHDVVALDNCATGSALNLGPGTFLRLVDVAESAEVEGPVDWVLHLASPASPVAYRSRPIDTLRAGSLGTLNLLDLAVEKGAAFLLASTSEVYGDPLVHPQPETYWGNVNPVGWRSCYDEAKRFAEALTVAYAKERSADVRIARIFNTYGPRMALDDGRPVVTFVKAALEGRPLPVQGDGQQTRSFCYVSDMVDALRLLMDSGYPDPMNLGNTHEITILELAETVLRLTGSQSEIEFVRRVTDDPQQRRPDTTLARRVLGWFPAVPLEVGIRRVIEYVAAPI